MMDSDLPRRGLRRRSKAAALFTPCALFLLSFPASAAERGDFVIQVGWLHFALSSSSTNLSTNVQPSLLGTLTGVQTSFTSPGTSASVSDGNTAALAGTYFLGNHLAVQAIGGVPAFFTLHGSGTVAPTGPLGQLLYINLGSSTLNPLAKFREWTPVVELQYYMGEPKDRWHPYLGVGATYSWFSNITLNPAFENALNTEFGTLLALSTGHAGPTHTEASASRRWNPVFSAGLTYDITRRLGVAASATYVPLQSTAAFDVVSSDDVVLSQSRIRIRAFPLISELVLSYRFRLF